ncbi:hypothetical protein HanRHA438_Chr09g0380511 [Helianthus annuus]|nr:hypothetical protein HanRHA438_Chr09g0380511 [Helianthus annuus]
MFSLVRNIVLVANCIILWLIRICLAVSYNLVYVLLFFVLFLEWCDSYFLKGSYVYLVVSLVDLL